MDYSKGNQILGMIQRNITYTVKELIVPLYKAIVRPHLESGLWSRTIGQVLKYLKYFGSSTSTSTLYFRQSSTQVHQVLTRQVQVQVHILILIS